ncbi:hypothetical protein MTO96_008564 [Rhipicephalus appendiculatus]
MMKVLATFGALGVFLGISGQCFQMDCDTTLPWNISSQDHQEIPSDRIEELLRCPHGLHGCSDSPVYCKEGFLAVTCSCERNCNVYGSCCWDTEVHESPASRAKCTSRKLENDFTKEFYAVTGCNRDWPKDDIRMSCENVTSEHDPFFFIPVTTEQQVTYFNAFCALCNYDLDNTSIFWSASGKDTEDLTVNPPQYATDNEDTFFWPCDSTLVNVDACPKGSDAETMRRCLTYFSPVQQTHEKPEVNASEVVYKNVYCGLCNGVDISSLKCVPMQAVRQSVNDDYFFLEENDITMLIRPVVSQSSCFAWHNSRCYIKVPKYLFSNSSTVDRIPTNTTTISHHAYHVRDLLSTVCISLSLVCLFLKGVVFAFYKSSRTFSSRCTMCLSVTLFWTHLIFLLADSLDVFKPYCTVFAPILHFGFLSTFFWTSVLSFDIWKNVVTARLSSSKRSGLMAYGLIAWGVPALVVSVGILLDQVAPHIALSPKYGRYSCWIGSNWNQFVFLTIPMTLLLLFDIGLYVHIVVHVRKTAKRAAAFDFKGGDSMSNMALFVKLAFIMGIPWILAFVNMFIAAFALDIAVIVFVGLQGVYLLFGFQGLQVPASEETAQEESWDCTLMSDCQY